MFLTALRPSLRRICGSHPSGREWTDLHELVQHTTLTEANLQALASDAGIAAGPASGRAASDAAAPSKRKGEHTRRSDSARAPAPSAKRPRSDSDRSASAPAGKKRARPSPFGLTDAEAVQRCSGGRCIATSRVTAGGMLAPNCRQAWQGGPRLSATGHLGL